MLLLGVPALPLPTGGITHVFEIIAILLGLQTIAGGRRVWLPDRWRRIDLGGTRWSAFLTRLMRLIRAVERRSRPRLRRLFALRVGRAAFGLLVLAFSLGAFLAPPFTGLDTLPALGGVLLSLGFLLEDALLAAFAILVGAAGIVLEVAVGAAVLSGVESLV